MKHLILFVVGSLGSFTLTFRGEEFVSVLPNPFRAVLLFFLLLAGPVLAGLMKPVSSVPKVLVVESGLLLTYTVLFVSQATGEDSPRCSLAVLEAATIIAGVQFVAYAVARLISNRSGQSRDG